MSGALARLKQRSRGESGIGLVELLVALTVLSIVFVATSVALVQTIWDEATGKAVDGARQIATAFFSNAESLGCDLETGTASPSAALASEATCYPAVSPAPASLGYQSWHELADGHHYTVTANSTWTMLDTSPGSCYGPMPSSGPMAAGLQRTVTVTWTEYRSGRPYTETFTASSFQATPPDDPAYYDSTLGAVAVSVAPGQLGEVAVHSTDTGQWLYIEAAPLKGASCVLFPFIPPDPSGQYPVVKAGPAGDLQTVTVTSGQVTDV